MNDLPTDVYILILRRALRSATRVRPMIGTLSLVDKRCQECMIKTVRDMFSAHYWDNDSLKTGASIVDAISAGQYTLAFNQKSLSISIYDIRSTNTIMVEFSEYIDGGYSVYMRLYIHNSVLTSDMYISKPVYMSAAGFISRVLPELHLKI